MMRLLGIPFVKSDGEAEAMCAWLNENNVSYLGAVEISNSQCSITPSSCFNVSFTIYVTVGPIIGIQSTSICDSDLSLSHLHSMCIFVHANFSTDSPYYCSNDQLWTLGDPGQSKQLLPKKFPLIIQDQFGMIELVVPNTIQGRRKLDNWGG